MSVRLPRYFEDKYLLTLPRMPATGVIRSFPSGRPGENLLWNESNGFHILSPVSIGQIEEITRAAQKCYLARIWETTMARRGKDGKTAWAFTQNGVAFHMRPAFVAERLRGLSMAEVRRWPTSKQIQWVRSVTPTTLEEARERASANWMIGYSRIPAIAPSQNGIRDPERWLEHFFGYFGLPTRSGLVVALITLLQLKNRGFILPPNAVIGLFSCGVGQYVKRHPDVKLDTESLGSHLARVRELFQAISRVLGEGLKYRLTDQSFIVGQNSDEIGLRSHELLLCTNYKNDRDISWEFCEAFRRPVCTERYARWGYSVTLTRFLSTCAKRNCGPRKIEKKDPFVPTVLRVAGDCSAIPEWVNALEGFRAARSGRKTVGSMATLFGHFMRWVKTTKLPSPTAVTKADICDDKGRAANTLCGYLAGLEGSARRKNEILALVNVFFNWVATRHDFENPVRYEVHRFPFDGPARRKTSRSRIASYVLDDMRDMLVVRSEQGLSWSEWSRKTTVLHEGKYVFCPILPAIYYILLRWPLRSNQVAFLDSGELDALRFNFEQRRFEPNPAGEKERGRIGEPRRAMGVLQPAGGKGRSSDEEGLDFQIALNKRPVGERSDYTIPFVDTETYWVIEEVIRWQRQFGSEPMFVKESADPERDGIAQDAPTVHRLPWLCCLFRDHAGDGFPPSHNRLATYWNSICVDYDRQNAQWHNPATGVIGRRPLWPRMSEETWEIDKGLRKTRHAGLVQRNRTRIRRVALHDIHSLRAGGISRLLEHGLPLAMVASIAGHRSLHMTLHYYIGDRETVRKKLSEVMKSDPKLRTRTDEIERRLSDVKSHHDWLLGASPAAFTALAEAVAKGGNVRIGTTGICPGTACEEGLKLERTGSHGGHGRGLVPGSLCGLCSFRLYGPAFLPGLVKEFNETIYALHQTARRQVQLRRDAREAEARGDRDRAVLCRNEDEELGLRAEPDCAHVARMFEMIQECLHMLRGPSGTGSANPALSGLCALKPPTAAELHEVGAFEQMKEILDVAEIMPAHKSLIPDQVNERFQRKLLALLYRNGADPFLAGLPDDVAKQAVLRFADLLQRSIPRRDQLEDVFAGKLLLRDVGFNVQQEALAEAKKLSGIKPAIPGGPMPKAAILPPARKLRRPS